MDETIQKDSKHVKSDGRIEYITGIKGYMCIVVVFFHLMICFYPATYFKDATSYSQGYVDVFLGSSPLFGIINGSFAVFIFWMISGFLFGIAFLRNDDLGAATSRAFRRWPRLFLPMAASILFGFVIIKLGLTHNIEAAEYCSGGSNWILSTSAASPTLTECVVNIYRSIFIGGSNLNAPTWTMATEFIGSFIIVALQVIFLRNASLKQRIVIYIVAICLLGFFPRIICMIVGLLVAEIYESKKKIAPYVSFILLVVGFLLSGYPLYVDSDFPLYKVIGLLGRSNGYEYCYVLASFCLLLALINLRWMQKLFSLKLMRILGKYSYSVYLVHFPIVMSFSLWTFVQLVSLGGLSHFLSALVSSLLTIPLVLVAAWLFNHLIEEPSEVLSRKLYRRWSVSLQE